MDNLIITITTLLAICGGITIIVNAIKSIKEILPLAKLSERVEKLENHAETADEKYEKLQRIINAQSKLLIEMTTHMLTGNDIEKLTKRRDELTDEIIDDK